MAVIMIEGGVIPDLDQEFGKHPLGVDRTFARGPYSEELSYGVGFNKNGKVIYIEDSSKRSPKPIARRHKS